MKGIVSVDFDGNQDLDDFMPSNYFNQQQLNILPDPNESNIRSSGATIKQDAPKPTAPGLPNLLNIDEEVKIEAK